MTHSLEPVKIHRPIRFYVLVALVYFVSRSLTAECATTALGDQSISTKSDSGPSSGTLYRSNASAGEAETQKTETLGTPTLLTAEDAGDATMRLTWENSHAPPAAFLATVWDIYVGRWVNNEKLDDSIFPFKAGMKSGHIKLKTSGGYHVSLSNLYEGGSIRKSMMHLSVQILSGVPHGPISIRLENRSELKVRLFWKPEIFGTWYYQIIAYEIKDTASLDGQFVKTQGPLGNSFFHFVDYAQRIFLSGTANFMEGWADFTMPRGGRYLFYIRGVPWREPFTLGEYAVSSMFTIGNEKE